MSHVLFTPQPPPDPPSNPVSKTRKLRRISRACDFCHKRSIKCQPSELDASSCQNCLDFEVSCTYYRPAKKRGIKTGTRPKTGNDTKMLLDLTNGVQGNGTFNVVDKFVIPTQCKSMVIASEEKIRDLVEVYFQVVYPIFPFFHRPRFMRRIISREYLSDHAFFAEVMSMCALASARARDGALFPGRWAPDHFEDPPPEKFYGAASSVVPPNLNSMKGLDWMRTCSLLALYGIQIGRVEIMHKFLGLYLSLVAADSLQDEKNWPQGSIVEVELRRRLFWSMYSLEVYSSIVWGSVIRCREAQSYVKYPTEIDDENFSDLGYENNGPINSSLVWLQGWNFTTQLYCVLEHAMDEFHHRRSRHKDASSPQSMYSRHVQPEKAVLDKVMHMYEALPEEFKKAKLNASTGRAGEEDRCSFQAAHITATLQLLRMILFTAEDATVDQKCAIARDLLDGFAKVPLFFLQAMSSPLLYHVASVGSILGSVIEGPLSQSAYMQVRQVLFQMVELLSSLEAEIKREVGASGRLRAQITKMDSFMTAQRQQNFASGGPSMQNTLINTSLPPNMDSDVAMRISMPNSIGGNPYAQRAYEFSGDGDQGNTGGNPYAMNKAYDFSRHEDTDAEGEPGDLNQLAGNQQFNVQIPQEIRDTWFWPSDLPPGFGVLK